MTQSDPIHPMPGPMTPERLAEIERDYRRVADSIAVDHPVDSQERGDHKAIGDLLAEVRHLQSQVARWRDARNIAIEAGDLLVERNTELSKRVAELEARIPDLQAAIAYEIEKRDRFEAERNATRDEITRLVASEAVTRAALEQIIAERNALHSEVERLKAAWSGMAQRFHDACLDCGCDRFVRDQFDEATVPGKEK